MTCILDKQIPLREELELMIVKVVLKPALTMFKKSNNTTSNNSTNND